MAENEVKLNSPVEVSTSYQSHRPRRLRLSPSIRRMVRETTLTPDDFIYPLFIRHGSDMQVPIASMPGQFQLTLDRLPAEARAIAALGIPAVILFGIPAYKDDCGSDNFDEDGIIPQAIRIIKESAPALVVISDMCFCEYTDHGHCGLINTPASPYFDPNLPLGYLLNDPTLRASRPRLSRPRPRRRRYHSALRHARRHGRGYPWSAR